MRPRSDHPPFGQLTPWRKRPPRRKRRPTAGRGVRAHQRFAATAVAIDHFGQFHHEVRVDRHPMRATEAANPPKKGHVGKHRSTAVCAVDDGRSVADRAAGAAHRAGRPLVDHPGPGLRLRPLRAGNGHPDAAHPEQRDPPNIAALLTVEFGLRLTQSIGTFAGLDYLGLGARPPGADRGLMIQESQRPGQRTVERASADHRDRRPGHRRQPRHRRHRAGCGRRRARSRRMRPITGPRDATRVPQLAGRDRCRAGRVRHRLRLGRSQVTSDATNEMSTTTTRRTAG